MLDKFMAMGFVDGLDGEVAFEKGDVIHGNHEFIPLLLHSLLARLHRGSRLHKLPVRCEKVWIIAFLNLVAVSIDFLVRLNTIMLHPIFKDQNSKLIIDNHLKTH